MNQTLRSSLLALTTLVALTWPLSAGAQSFKADGPAGTGGGNGIAAEIDRATDAFIQLVRENPAMFPEVDPDALAKYDPEIRVTSKKILTCDTQDELEAWSDSQESYSRFNFAAWVGKPWIDKVHFAGHERLVIAKLEKSNTYKISNRIYKVANAQLEAKFGPTKPVCSHGGRACDMKKHVIDDLKYIMSNLGPEDIRPNTATLLIGGTEDVLESEVLMLIGLKKVQLKKLLNYFSTDEDVRKVAEQVVDFEEELRRSVDAELKPLIIQARQLLAEQTQKSDNTCVNLKAK